ncbi:RtcB family protein [Treponema pedis]|uniref:3'-phosphate/5'-hydroxy nucleic acid ligase n=1 Tax=Treponema pedis TaxID=409322 RepID=A0A7S6WPS8_9SPIR|nr:RtcB family protein [Treponema pedis]QOW60864.1 RtcB family protein [Treponema pedis]
MQTIRGKYNKANVMIDSIDSETEKQIKTFLNHKAFEGTNIAVMPDCHAGKGAVIGFTMNMDKYIIPNIVGVDIGCGILSAQLNIKNPNLAELDNFIKKNIPSGTSVHRVHKVDNKEFEEEIIEESKKVNMDTDRALKSVGTLGGGNHFIELGKDSQGRFWLTIHSGSRNLGLQIAVFYQKKAKEILETSGIFSEEDKNLEYLLTESAEGKAYLHATYFAQKYAKANRLKMIELISEFLNTEPVELVESVHNFIGNDGIIRKGATSAKLDEKLIIPFNMRDGLAFCRGKGNDVYNQSAPHGAGRIMSRTKAFASLSLKTFQKEMYNAGIFTTTATKNTLDESPAAYKDKEIILKHIKPTADIKDFVKPIYNFKSPN